MKTWMDGKVLLVCPGCVLCEALLGCSFRVRADRNGCGVVWEIRGICAQRTNLLTCEKAHYNIRGMGDVCSDQEPKLEVIQTYGGNQRQKVPDYHSEFKHELASSIVDKFRPSYSSQLQPNEELPDGRELAPLRKIEEESISFDLVTVPPIREEVSAVLKTSLRQSIKIDYAEPIVASSFKGREKPVQYIEEKELFYEGEWQEGQPHGKATIYYPSGAYFQGYFRQGLVESKDSILVLPDGSFYRGQMSGSLFEGEGSFTSAQGTTYRGEWKAGVPHGQGEESFSDGNSYIGAFQRGTKHGKGVFKWRDGKVYEGDFVNGKMEGIGKFSKGEELYEGYFQRNKKIGRNKLRTEFGVYSAEFVDGRIQGEGTFEWNNHTVYEGGFKNGVPHGEGTMRFAEGKIIDGEWEDGKNMKIKDAKPRSRSKSKSSVK